MTELAIAGRNGGTPGGFKFLAKTSYTFDFLLKIEFKTFLIGFIFRGRGGPK